MKTLKDFTPQGNRLKDEKQNLYHIFEPEDIAALWAAYAAGRPLLIRGKPGTGKSQTARAIACHLGWAFVSQVIRGDTELSDLHYFFDAVARLGEAQALGSGGDRSNLDAVNFLSPGAFWWTYDPHSALLQHRRCRTPMRSRPYSPKGWREHIEQDGVVLLLDEMDKANPDLPNGLLETIGERSFSVPYLADCDSDRSQSEPGQEMPTNPVTAGSIPLLIVITTNEERDLPQAFVRRCFVHTLKMNDDDSPLASLDRGSAGDHPVTVREQWLVDRGRFRFGNRISEKAYAKAARLLWQDREKHRNKHYAPGLAEYIDLLEVLATENNHDNQEALIDTIAGYAYDKELKK